MPFRERSSVLEFRAEDPDHTREFFRRQGFGDHSRVLRGHRAFGYRLWASSGDRIAVGRVESRSSQVLRATSPYPTVHLPLRSRFQYRIGRRTLEAEPDTAMFLAPGHEYTLFAPGGGALATTIAPELLQQEMERRSPASRKRQLLQSVNFRMSPGRRAEFLTLRRRLIGAVTAIDSAGDQSRVPEVEREFAGWLAERVLEQSGLQPVSAACLERLNRLIGWIDNRLFEDITIGRLCGVAGVSERLLQHAFRAAYGMTPLEFVRARRLAAAHRRMLAPRDGDTVAEIALDCGLSHLGRFSVSYRHLYGESPSDTLARGKERAGHPEPA